MGGKSRGGAAKRQRGQRVEGEDGPASMRGSRTCRAAAAAGCSQVALQYDCLAAAAQPARHSAVLFRPPSAACVPPLCRRSSVRYVADARGAQLAIHWGHLPSRALKAWMLINGSGGVTRDHKTAFELAEEGVHLGCHHCKGVISLWHRGEKRRGMVLPWGGFGRAGEEAAVRSLQLARESSAKGSRYGQCTLDMLYSEGAGGLETDHTQAAALFRLAAAQNLAEAQCNLGIVYYDGCVVALDFVEALRWWQLAAAQGHPAALFFVGQCYERGHGVRKCKAAAIRFYSRVQEAGFDCYLPLQRLLMQ
jgi:TPR repeat protein